MNLKMKNLVFSTSFLLLNILVWSCRNASGPLNETSVIDITGKCSEMTLKLEDIAEDIKLIRLETDKNAMIRYFRGYVGEKNIVSVDREKILQFSSDGQFIRVIAINGLGPGEFGQIDAWDVDENEHFFLFHDVGKNYISKYNLDSFKFENNIPFTDKGYLSNILTVNDTLLIILPGMFSNYGYLYFYQSTSGRICEGIKKEPVLHPGVWAGKTPVFRKMGDDSFIFQPSESDTIFKIDRSQFKPLISLLTEEPQKNGEITRGSYISFLFQNDKKIFLQKLDYETLKTPNSVSTRTLENVVLMYDRKSRKPYSIKPFYHDYLGVKLDIHSIDFLKGNQFVVFYQALEFKNMLRDAFQKGEIPDPQKEKLQQLFDHISEFDNPILITGRIR